MFVEPNVKELESQPYVAIPQRITMDGFAKLDLVFEELLGWLSEREIQPKGPQFLRLIVIDMEKYVDMEVGVLVGAPVEGDGRVVCREVPAGAYLTLRYTAADQNEHIAANSHFLRWAADHGLEWDNDLSQLPETWGGRFEFLIERTEDGQQVTELAFLTKRTD
jgi:effector-binding domain-containing protein